ncbi:hypothetical protein M0G74_10820 [Microbulbifer sp. CAU 1566]|uniref:tetratricopeptide repeat protein n=1 Tax=Microbulbifer sp. CAU 1566 TaxID=2933269 RepID=UPI002005E30F|nr:hypothetical protein [Microbulbifer sp. CAU 1566]MCK7597762.1 hypothetical protein [Microbulbifer sp. CAU 1566]
MKYIALLVSLFLASKTIAQEDCKELVRKISESGFSATEKLHQLDELRSCTNSASYKYKKSVLLASNRDLQGALSILENTSDWGELEEHVVLLRAKIYSVSATNKEAIEILDKYLASHNGGASIHYYKGTLLNSQRKFSEAINSFINSVKVAPNSKSYQAAAVSYYALGQCDNAVSSIDQAATLDESTFGDLGSMLVMSRCYAMQGKFVVASNALKILLQNNPSAEENSDFKEALTSLRAKIAEAKKSGDASTDAHLVSLRDI